MADDKVPQLLWFLISGKGLFIGVLSLAAAGFITFPKINRWRKLSSYFFILCGIVITFLSATPFPIPFYVCWAAVIVLWSLVISFNLLPSRKLPKIMSLTLVMCSMIACLAELPNYTLPTIPNKEMTRMYLIGDSISAGIGTEEEMTWPKIIRLQHNIDLIDLSIAGATVGSALKKQAPQIGSDNAVVLLEIGGNDSLQATSYQSFERDLRNILQQVSMPSRLVIMLEIPVLPWHIRYAEIQRRLAKEFDAVLIPKKFLISIFAKEGNTLDLAHLSEQGHRFMAENIWKIISNAFRAL